MHCSSRLTLPAVQVDNVASENGATHANARQQPKPNCCNDDARGCTLAEAPVAANLPCIDRHTAGLSSVSPEIGICVTVQPFRAFHTSGAEMEQQCIRRQHKQLTGNSYWNACVS